MANRSRAKQAAKGSPGKQSGKSSGKGSGKGGAKQRTGPPPKPSRYTPPTPKTKKVSPLWVPAAMFTCLGLGLLVIVANFLGLLFGGEARNENLAIGLVLMVAGFGLSTNYR